MPASLAAGWLRLEEVELTYTVCVAGIVLLARQRAAPASCSATNTSITCRFADSVTVFGQRRPFENLSVDDRCRQPQR